MSRTLSALTLALIPLALACPPAPVEPQPAPFGLDERPENTSCAAPQRPNVGATISLEDAWPNLRFQQPVWVVQGPGERMYVLEKRGIIWHFEDDPAVTDVQQFVDLRGIVEDGFNEAGLLGLAFHPQFEDNGQVFLSYTTAQAGLTSEVARFISLDDGDTLDTASREPLLTVGQPFANHNGGGILFGPDGFLYIGLGDGGSANDPEAHGQNTDTLLSAMLRIDVSPPAGYAIPTDNPFAQSGGAPEIFAWGLRNPWRFSFDRATGELWAGDVGQNAWEEIDVVELGGNYGWKLKEGFFCRGSRTATCDDVVGVVDPIVQYHNDIEGKSVTGGYVYRGSSIPALEGTYIYADFTYGTLWGLFFDPVTGEPDPQVLLQSGASIASFGENNDGELFVIAFSNAGGRIMRVVAGGDVPVDAFPARLSETGCVDPDDPTQPAVGMIPYAVTAPFYSNGVDKERYLALPDGEALSANDDGSLEFPTGSVLMKSFRLDGALIETRLMVLHDDDEWAGYTYQWRDDGEDADLLRAAAAKDWGEQRWTYPSRPQCLGCHTEAGGRTLGTHLKQLDTEAVYASTNRLSPQLDTWAHIGILDAELPSVPKLVDPFGDAPLEDRARSYLDANCAHCHLPGGVGRGTMDLRASISVAASGICDGAPEEGDLGIAGARLLVPGDPERSLLWVRMIATDASRMPDIARDIVDQPGADLIERWIRSLSDCP